MDGFISPQALADRLSLDRKTIYRAIDRRELRAVKIGTVIRIAEGDAQAWLDKCLL